jgi:hypothetical protein
MRTGGKNYKQTKNIARFAGDNSRKWCVRNADLQSHAQAAAGVAAGVHANYKISTRSDCKTSGIAAILLGR